MSPDTPDQAKPPRWNANLHYQDDKVAAEYDAVRFSSMAGRVFNTLERQTITKAFSGLPKGARIADIPCGTGRLAEPLLEAGFRVHGMDISAQMLDVASRRLQRFGNAFTTEAADAKTLPGTHETYDGVLCARVLMHFEFDEQIEFLRGVSRLTRGPIVINHSFSSLYQRNRRRLKRVLGHAQPARFPVTHQEIERLLSGSALREVQRYRLNPLISEAVYIVALPVSTDSR